MRHSHQILNRPLQFKRPSGTSRGVLKEKGTSLLVGYQKGEICGLSEVSTIPGLSPEYKADIDELIRQGLKFPGTLTNSPAVKFGLEIWKRSLTSKYPTVLFDSPFMRGEAGIPINGLIWMGEKQFMLDQIKQKLDDNFTCIKLKIGAINFQEELDLLRHIRNEYSVDDIEIRVDANGAFAVEDAAEKLKRLSAFDLHSIEQPIRQGQSAEMEKLCRNTPIPIALDEELIGISNRTERIKLLDDIAPQYIILKPSLVGGWRDSEEWIVLAKERNIGWWVTSALEGNIGLNAIASWTATLDNPMPQGLGTGGLFTNNIPSPLIVRDAKLWNDPSINWDLSSLKEAYL